MLGAITEIYATQEDNISVIVNVQGKPPFRVTAMEDRLVQVFRNLIQNAISFSPISGCVQLSLSRTSDFVQIDVLDEGPGLPEGKLAAVFDRFYSERPEGEKFGMHSGLGLSISKQIIEAHGGKFTPRIDMQQMEHFVAPASSFFCLLPKIDRAFEAPQAYRDENCTRYSGRNRREWCSAAGTFRLRKV